MEMDAWQEMPVTWEDGGGEGGPDAGGCRLCVCPATPDNADTLNLRERNHPHPTFSMLSLPRLRA